MNICHTSRRLEKSGQAGISRRNPVAVKNIFSLRLYMKFIFMSQLKWIRYCSTSRLPHFFMLHTEMFGWWKHCWISLPSTDTYFPSFIPVKYPGPSVCVSRVAFLSSRYYKPPSCYFHCGYRIIWFIWIAERAGSRTKRWTVVERQMRGRRFMDKFRNSMTPSLFGQVV